MPHPDRELIAHRKVMRSCDRDVTHRAGPIELRMPVRIDDEREDLRCGRCDQDSPDDASWAGVDHQHG